MIKFTDGIEGILIVLGIIGGFLVILFIMGVYSSIADPIRERREKKRREMEKETEKQNEEIRRFQKQMEAEQARARRDLAQDKMQNVIINCPPCRGQGGARSYPGNYKDWTDWEKGYNWDVPEPGPVKTEHGDDWRECPFCGGKGIAIAVIQRDVQTQCDECRGSGQVLEKFAARLDIGIEKCERMIPCRSCGGLGEIKRDVVTVRTLQVYGREERFELYLTDANRRFFYTNRPLEIPIQDFIQSRISGPRS
ncbi:hypothetical protein EHM69_06120 [candidate division KSB1 bacterium]|nr:MAG: hypothetical protein EHM69_06120 [candidate division KSB1 bacterium]